MISWHKTEDWECEEALKKEGIKQNGSWYSLDGTEDWEQIYNCDDINNCKNYLIFMDFNQEDEQSWTASILATVDNMVVMGQDNSKAHMATIMRQNPLGLDYPAFHVKNLSFLDANAILRVGGSLCANSAKLRNSNVVLKTSKMTSKNLLSKIGHLCCDKDSQLEIKEKHAYTGPLGKTDLKFEDRDLPQLN